MFFIFQITVTFYYVMQLTYFSYQLLVSQSKQTVHGGREELPQSLLNPMSLKQGLLHRLFASNNCLNKEVTLLQVVRGT